MCVSSIHRIMIVNEMIRSSDPLPFTLSQLLCIFFIVSLNPIRYLFWLLLCYPLCTPLYRTSLFLLYTLYTAYILFPFVYRYSYYFLIVISLKLDAPFNGLVSYRVDSRPIIPTVIRIKIIPSIVSLLFIRFIWTEFYLP